ncbi:MAG: hypothetical protein MI923_06545 [Phycisphaerales bacterium]|nr:hypothetical protein [Phycisphaerales bacterium]
MASAVSKETRTGDESTAARSSHAQTINDESREDSGFAGVSQPQEQFPTEQQQHCSGPLGEIARRFTGRVVSCQKTQLVSANSRMT